MIKPMIIPTASASKSLQSKNVCLKYLSESSLPTEKNTAINRQINQGHNPICIMRIFTPA